MDASATDPVSLQEVFALLPEVRQARGRRHPLRAILNLTAVALLAGMKSLEAIAQLARDHGPPLAEALGFTLWPTPCKATRSNVFRRLDVAAYEDALSTWLKRRCPDGGDTIAMDGQTLRGSASHQVPGVHLLSAYAGRVAAVIAPLRVQAQTNEHQAALELLGVWPRQGKIVTGDAMFCQRDFGEEVIQRQGDYVLTVKDNQPTMLQHIATMFAESSAFSPYQQQRWAEEQDVGVTHTKGHGRRDKRTLRVTPIFERKVPRLAGGGAGFAGTSAWLSGRQGGGGDGVRH